MDFKSKYIKYKNKYLKLKGGATMDAKEVEKKLPDKNELILINAIKYVNNDTQFVETLMDIFKFVHPKNPFPPITTQLYDMIPNEETIDNQVKQMVHDSSNNLGILLKSLYKSPKNQWLFSRLFEFNLIEISSKNGQIFLHKNFLDNLKIIFEKYLKEKLAFHIEIYEKVMKNYES